MKNVGQFYAWSITTKAATEGTIKNIAEAIDDKASYRRDDAIVVIENIEVETPADNPDITTETAIDSEINENTEDIEDSVKSDETQPIDLPNTGVANLNLLYGFIALSSGTGLILTNRKR